MERTRIICLTCRRYNATREFPITRESSIEERTCSKCGAADLANDGKVKGKFADVQCTDKCETATSATCKCACGGEHHGERA